MRLFLVFLLLFCVASIGGRFGGGGRGGGGSRSWGGGGRSWGGGGRSSWGGGGRSWGGGSRYSGGSRGSSYARSSIGRGGYSGGGYRGGGRYYTAPRSYYSGSYGIRPAHYSYGSVHGWRYHYSPVYMYGGYRPLIVHPIYTGHYYSCGWGCGYYSVPYHSYHLHYYTSTRHMESHEKNIGVKCTRPASDLNKTDLIKLQNATSEESKEIAWACPAKHVCCAWECCKDPDAEEEESSPWKWVWISIGIFFGVIVLIALLTWLWCCIRDCRNRKYFQPTGPVTPAHDVYDVPPPPVYETPPPAYGSVVHGGYGTGGYGMGGNGTYPAQPVY